MLFILVNNTPGGYLTIGSNGLVYHDIGTIQHSWKPNPKKALENFKSGTNLANQHGDR